MAIKSQFTPAEKAKIEEISKMMKDMRALNAKFYREAVEITSKSNKLVMQSYQLASMRFGNSIDSFYRIR